MTEQDYRRLFERVEPAPALVERTLSAAGARPRRRHPVRRAAALVVAGALLAGLSASFAAVKPVSPNVVTLAWECQLGNRTLIWGGQCQWTGLPATDGTPTSCARSHGMTGML